MSQHGVSPTALRLLQLGIPVTVENWLDFNYPQGVPNPVDAELQAEAEEAVRSVQKVN
jgi:hypothetical protein